MNREDIIRMAREAGFVLHAYPQENWLKLMERFAALVAAEKEQQMLRDGWRQCAKGQRTTQHCGLLDAAVKAEREDCAMLCEELAHNFRNQKRGDFDTRYDWLEDAAMDCADAINNRGKVKP